MMKKAQAAMEFLMTYGWAILAAIIAIGVLYLVIGNPANILGDRFQISDPFIKVAQAATSTGVTLEFKNGAGESVNITNVSVQTCGSNEIVGEVADGASKQVVVACTLTPGNRVKGAVTISYTVGTATTTQVASGSVNLKVN